MFFYERLFKISKNTDWQNIEGVFEKKRKFKLRASEEDNTFKCPVKYSTKDSRLKEAVESILKVDMAGIIFLTKNQMYKALRRKYAAQTTSQD